MNWIIIINSSTANVDSLTNVKTILSSKRDSDSFDFTNFNTLKRRNVLNGDKLIDGISNSVSNSSVIISMMDIITMTRSKMLNYSKHYLSKPSASILITASSAKIVVNN